MDEQCNDISSKIDTFILRFDALKCKKHDALYCFEHDHEINHFLSSLKQVKTSKPQTSYKDIMREKLSSTLGFSQNDIILFANDITYGKIFFQVCGSENADKRACGLPMEFLEQQKHSFFAHQTYKKNILDLLSHAIEDILDFRRLLPSDFRKKFVPILVNIVEIVVIKETQLLDCQNIRGLTYYLLREIFDELMLFMAEDILLHFFNQDKKAIEFLNYFTISHNLDSKETIQRKKNLILDENNYPWSVPAIRSTLIQYKKIKQSWYDKKTLLMSLKNKLEIYRQEIHKLEQQLTLEQHALKEVEEKMEIAHQTIENLEKSNEPIVHLMENGEEKAFERKLLITKLIKQENELIRKKGQLEKNLQIPQNIMVNKQKEIATWERKYTEEKELLKSMESKTHPAEKQYEQLRRAFAKALATP